MLGIIAIFFTNPNVRFVKNFMIVLINVLIIPFMMHNDKNITLNFLKCGSLYFFQRHFYFGDKAVFFTGIVLNLEYSNSCVGDGGGGWEQLYF